MTIITKPHNEKKQEKSVVPLVVTEGQIPTAPAPSVNGDTDPESVSVVFHRHRTSSATTVFLFLSAIAVMCMGILGGVAIYRLYAPSQERYRFHGYYGIPYDSEALSSQNDFMKLNDDFPASSWEFIKNATRQAFSPWRNWFSDDLGNGAFFREEFELDLSDDESYAKITVPDFKDGRRGRFMHDFKKNQSAIIDTDEFRCFIMPLDRETVLPPKSLHDLLSKMWTGYYDIDTKRVRKNFRVVTPAVIDLSTISRKIAHECVGMKVYMLDKYVSGVYKRSTEFADSDKFAEFSGKNIVEFHLINLDEIKEMEKKEINNERR